MRAATSFTLLLAAAIAISGCGRDLTSPASDDRAAVALTGHDLAHSVNANRCKDYQDWFTRDGQPFTSVGECVSHAAKKGNQLINADALACLNGGWQSLGSESAPFASEQECVDHAVGTGTPLTYADISIATDPGTLGCGEPFDPAFCTSIHIRVYNAGPATATVSWSLNGTYQREHSSLTLIVTGTNGTCTDADDQQGTWSASCTGTTVPPGGSTFIAHVVARNGATQAGTVSITASSLPDPDASNNSFSWNFTAPSPQ